MIDMTQAAQEAQKLIGMLQGVQIVSDAMTQIGSFEQAINEVKTRHGVVAALVDDLSAVLAEKQAELVKVTASALEVVATATQEAEKLRQEGVTEFARILDSANMQAQEIVALAEGNSAAALESLAMAKIGLDQVIADRVTAQAELDRVNGLLAQIKGS